MTNRDRMARVLRDIQQVRADEAVSPTPYDHLRQATSEIAAAMGFALDMDERDGINARNVIVPHVG